MRLSTPTVGVGRHVGLTGPNPETRTTWIHVAPEGEWEGHPAGPFSLDGEAFAQCVAALRACETPSPVDYDHSSLRPLDGQPTPAAGYILDLSIREDGLWALVELTERAADMVRAGEYRFCSGVFVWESADRETGEKIPCQLDSIGLTNKPFIDGQHAIRLSRRALGASRMNVDKKDLFAKIEALFPESSIDAAGLKALVEFLEASAEKPEEPAPEKPAEEKPASQPAAALAVPPPLHAAADAPTSPLDPATPSAAEATSDAAAMLLSKLAELTGLDTASLVASMDANAEQIKSAFLGGDGGSMPAAALSAKLEAQDAVIADLTAKVTAYQADEAKRVDASIVAEVETLVAAGKVLPGARDSFVALARKAPNEFRALAAKLPARVPMGRDAPVDAPTSAPMALGSGEVDPTHPRYVELYRHYSDPASPYTHTLPADETKRAAALDRMVRNHIKREQPVSG